MSCATGVGNTAISPSVTGQLALADTRYGPMVYLAQDRYIGGSLLRFGEYSESEVELFRFAVRPDSAVLDVGANIGAHTVALGKLAARVFAFEPQEICFQALRANLAMNELRNVTACHAAVGEKEGLIAIPQLDYGRAGNYGGLSITPGTMPQDGRPVRMVTLDSMHLGRWDFAKIDVEGMETQVLLGARESIRSWKPILYVENDRIDQARQLVDTIYAFDYRAYWHIAPLYNEQNFLGAPPDPLFAECCSLMLYCVPIDRSRPVPEALAEECTPESVLPAMRALGLT